MAPKMPARQRRKRKNEETALSRAIHEALTAKGCVVWRIQSGVLPVAKGGKTSFVHCAPAGSPDMLVIVANAAGSARYVHLEVKRKKGTAREAQLEWAAWAKENGVKSCFVRGITEAINAVFPPVGGR